MTSQPDAEIHFSFPVLNYLGTGCKGQGLDILGRAVLTIFAKYQGPLLLAGLASLASPVLGKHQLM